MTLKRLEDMGTNASLKLAGPMRSILALTACFIAIHILFDKANPFTAVPIYMDDYINLSKTFSNFQWSIVRPITYFIISALSACGVKFFYVVMSSMTLCYISLVFAFICECLQIRDIRWPCLLFSATAVMSFEWLVEYYTFTGIVANISAGLFAVSAMFIVIRQVNKEQFTWKGLCLATALATVSILTKEDFSLALLFTFGFAGLSKHKSTSSKGRVGFITLIVLGGLVALSQRLVASTYIAGSGFYAVSLSPLSIFAVGLRYLTISKGAALACVLQVVALLLVLFRGEQQLKLRMVFIQLLTLSILLPFTLLPGHVCEFYALDWVAWQCGSTLVLVPLIENIALPFVRLGAPCLLIALMPFIVLWTEPGRRNLLLFSKNEAIYNNNILFTLKEDRNLISKLPTVAVTGASLIGPWTGTNGDYLRTRLLLPCKWKVFTPESSDLYKVSRSLGLLRTKDVEICSLTELSSNQDLPRIDFNQAGVGTLVLPDRTNTRNANIPGRKE